MGKQPVFGAGQSRPRPATTDHDVLLRPEAQAGERDGAEFPRRQHRSRRARRLGDTDDLLQRLVRRAMTSTGAGMHSAAPAIL